MKKHVLLLLLFIPFFSEGQFLIESFTRDSINNKIQNLYREWKYHNGDSLIWANPGYDDKNWETADNDNTEVNTDRVKNFPAKNFSGIAWLRKTIFIDSTMAGFPAAFTYRHYGAAEIYVDGKLIGKFGTPSGNIKSEIVHFNIKPIPVPYTFSTGKKYLLAIRYSNFHAADVDSIHKIPFINFQIGLTDLRYAYDNKSIHLSNLVNALYVGIFSIFCIIHLLLFLNYREKKQNLYFSLFTFFFFCFFVMHGLFSRNFSGSIGFLHTLINLNIIFISLFYISFIGLFYSIFYTQVPKFFWFLISICFILFMLNFFRADLAVRAINYSGVLVAAEFLRIVIVSMIKKRKGSKIFGTGLLIIILSMGIMGFCSYLYSLGQMDSDTNFVLMIIFSGGIFLTIPFCMSIYLARDFALTNKTLKVQVKEIQELSAKAILQEQERKKILEDLNYQLEIKVAERTRELEQRQQQLIQSEKMASVGLLTAGIAHEINNPVNFVSANITPLKRDISEVLTLLEKYESVDPDNVQQKMEEILKYRKQIDLTYTLQEINSLINGIEEGSRRTSEIVKGLRNFTRLDENDLKNADVNEGIESTLVILHARTADRVEVIKKLDKTLPQIKCYPGQLNQVFMNILTNAIDAIEENGKITVTTYRENNKLKISIRDTGKGMTEEIKKKIFDPFFTTKDVGKGTGLGLSISYGIIEKHNGKIEVISAAGKGTEFVITLPL
ncbi:MAG TPA: ATP-binding protein [Bacteroidia bacterium]|nr:ATP-binding protein [Bacteroidia bacterium]